MTCYVAVKQEVDIKRRKEELLNQQKIELQKQHLREQYVKDGMVRQLQEHKAAEERVQQGLLAERKKRDEQGAEMRKRMKWRIDLEKYRVHENESPHFSVSSAKRKKPVPGPIPQKKGELATYAPRLLQHGKKAEGRKKAKPMPLAIKPALSLSVASSLPVSLSIGQAQVSARLLGKNSSASSIAAGLEVSVLDSQNAAIAAKLEPRACTLEPEGTSEFKVTFDLPEDVARGRLTLASCLKENAIYIDKQAAQSNGVLLSSQVKSPMNLVYVPGSAASEEGNLVLAFKNTGESGGILETSSWAAYFSQEGTETKAMLASRTKVKGGEKGIKLVFAPAGGAVPPAFRLHLVGTDSNGKPYLLKQNIAEKSKASG